MSLASALNRALISSPKKVEKMGDLLKERPPCLSAIIEEGQDSAHEQRGWLRPSALFSCDRQNIFRLTKAPMSPSAALDKRVERILNNGTAVHDVIQKYLGDHPDYWFAREAKVHKVVEGVLIRGSCDGILIRRSDGYRFGVEIKTKKHELFVSLVKPDKEHVVQASVYAYLHQVWWITILYWDKDQQYLKEYPVCYNPAVIEAVKERVRYLRGLTEKAVDGGPFVWTGIKRKMLEPFNRKQCDLGFCDHSVFCKEMGGSPVATNGWRK